MVNAKLCQDGNLNKAKKNITKGLFDTIGYTVQLSFKKVFNLTKN